MRKELYDIISKIDFSQLDEDVWDQFLEAEKQGNFKTQLFTIDNTYDSSNGINALSLIQIFTELCEYIQKNTDNYTDDKNFWQDLYQLFPNSKPLNIYQNILLVVIQSIFDGDYTSLALTGTKMYFSLCKLPLSMNHFFGPNIFIFRQIFLPLHTLIYLKKKNNENEETVDPNVYKSLVIEAINFLLSYNKSVLHTDHCRFAMNYLVELLVEIMLKWPDAELNGLAFNGLIKYVVEVHLFSKNTNTSSNLVPIVQNEVSGDILLFVLSPILLQIINCLSIKTSRKSNVESNRALEFVLTLIEYLPVLLHPDHLQIQVEKMSNKKERRKSNKKIDISSDSDENTNPRRKKKSLKSECYLNTINDPIFAIMAQCSLFSNTDRKDARESTIQIIKAIASKAIKYEIQGNPSKNRESILQRYSKFLLKMIISSKASWRLFGIEAIAYVIIESYIELSFDTNKDIITLIEAILHRLQDIQPTVRSRAIDCLAHLLHYTDLLDREKRLPEMFKQLFFGGKLNNIETPIQINFPTIIQNTVCDSKQLARKSCLSLIKSIIDRIYWLSGDKLQIYERLHYYNILSPTVLPVLATDSSILVRVRTQHILSDLISYFPFIERVQILWLKLVLFCAVCDPEKLVNERAIENVGSLLSQRISFNQIEKLSLENTDTAINNWPIWLILLQKATPNQIELFKRAFFLLIKQDQIPSWFCTLIANAANHYANNSDSNWPVEVFILMDELTLSNPKLISPNTALLCFIRAHNDLKVNNHQTITIYKTILSIITNILKNMNSDCVTQLTKLLIQDLQSQSSHTLTSSILTTLKIMSEYLNFDYSSKLQTIYKTQTKIFNNLLPEIHSLSDEENNKLIDSMFKIGNLISKWNEIKYDGVNEIIERLQTVITSKLNPSIVSAALIAYGNICLINDTLTKRMLPFIATQFSENIPEQVKCNALIIFADCFIRSAFLADRYLPQFTNALGSSNILIRKQTLSVLSVLLAQDYLKSKSFVLYRCLTLLGDSNRVVKSFAQTMALNIIIPKHTNFIQHHFIELLCFCCGLGTHPIFNPMLTVNGLLKINSPFCLIKYPSRRQEIYSFFLAQMNDRDRHEITRRMVHSFLTPFVDEDESGKRILSLPKTSDEPAGVALRDVLRIMGCRELKITFHKSQQSSKAEHPEEEQVEQSEQKIYELNLLKRNLANQILPTLLSLKRVMEDACSVFLGDIMQCLTALLFDYRSELSEILFNDPMLAKQLDIEYKRRAACGDHTNGRPALSLCEPITVTTTTHSASQLTAISLNTNMTIDKDLLLSRPSKFDCKLEPDSRSKAIDEDPGFSVEHDNNKNQTPLKNIKSEKLDEILSIMRQSRQRRLSKTAV